MTSEHGLEYGVVLPHDVNSGKGESTREELRGLTRKSDERRWILDRRCAERRYIEQMEEGEIQADARSQDQHRHQRENRRAAKYPQRVTQIFPEPVERSPSPGLT